jgi:NAD(P)H-hydrate epimerase
MQLPPLSRDQVRRVDQIAIEDFSMPGIVLMENAGRGASEVIDRIAKEGLIVILCGAGNNAGDGYVIARHLQLLGRSVRIVSIVDPDSLSGDAGINATIARKARIEIRRAETSAKIEESIAESMTVVDALLGTGAQGPPRGLFAEAVRAANQHPGQRIAIDLPTGLDCDTGLAHDPTFQAAHTITFVSRKLGFEKENADAYVGVVTEIGIGVPQCLLQDVLTW